MIEQMQNDFSRKIVVYGSSKPSEEIKEQANQLGHLLGKSYQVMAGAGGGVSNAFLSGASQVAPSDLIPIEIATAWDKEQDRLSKNINIKHVIVKDFNTSRSELLDAGVCIVFPGSIGTLAEIIAAIDNIGMDLFMNQTIKPIIFIGDYWKNFIIDNIAPIAAKGFDQFIVFENDINNIPQILENLINNN
jgi:predicted Rossmann-fold nucleotide-binding protein